MKDQGKRRQTGPLTVSRGTKPILLADRCCVELCPRAEQAPGLTGARTQAQRTFFKLYSMLDEYKII